MFEERAMDSSWAWAPLRKPPPGLVAEAKLRIPMREPGCKDTVDWCRREAHSRVVSCMILNWVLGEVRRERRGRVAHSEREEGVYKCVDATGGMGYVREVVLKEPAWRAARVYSAIWRRLSRGDGPRAASREPA